MRSFARGTKAALAIEAGCGSVRSALLFLVERLFVSGTLFCLGRCFSFLVQLVNGERLWRYLKLADEIRGDFVRSNQDITTYANYSHKPFTLHITQQTARNIDSFTHTYTAAIDIVYQPTNSRGRLAPMPCEQSGTLFHGGEIHCLRRLRKEGSPDFLSRS